MAELTENIRETVRKRYADAAKVARLATFARPARWNRSPDAAIRSLLL